MPKRTSIKRKLTLTFVIIILVTILIFELIFTYGMQVYYYSNIEQVLSDRMRTTIEVYDAYLGYESLASKAKYILESESVPDYVDAQVLDNKGNIIDSTARLRTKNPVITEDFLSALEGKTATWRGENPDTKEQVMSISAPLYRADNINGVIRYITSLEDVDKAMRSYLLYAYLIGLIVLLSVVYLSVLMANRLVEPIFELKDVADNIATGNLKVKAKEYDHDEIGELAETINYMVDEIKKTDKLKHDFISSVSHELRTPLTSIKGWSETILTGDIENVEETKLGLEIISKEADRLHGLVENLLDFSKLESERMKIVKADFDLKHLIERVFKQFYTVFKKRGITYKIFCTEREIIYNGDRNRLRQVFINVLDNALKHTPSGGVINCYVTVDSENIVIKIKDSGSGISKEHLESITEKFYKADTKKPGSGLGLAITKRIITLHQGDLKIESELGRGTTITIILPKV